MNPGEAASRFLGALAGLLFQLPTNKLRRARQMWRGEDGRGGGSRREGVEEASRWRIEARSEKGTHVLEVLLFLVLLIHLKLCQGSVLCTYEDGPGGTSQMHQSDQHRKTQPGTVKSEDCTRRRCEEKVPMGCDGVGLRGWAMCRCFGRAQGRSVGLRWIERQKHKRNEERIDEVVGRGGWGGGRVE